VTSASGNCLRGPVGGFRALQTARVRGETPRALVEEVRPKEEGRYGRNQCYDRTIDVGIDDRRNRIFHEIEDERGTESPEEYDVTAE
jgi:hypothetical protein